MFVARQPHSASGRAGTQAAATIEGNGRPNAFQLGLNPQPSESIAEKRAQPADSVDELRSRIVAGATKNAVDNNGVSGVTKTL
jgi:hypothetical protein